MARSPRQRRPPASSGPARRGRRITIHNPITPLLRRLSHIPVPTLGRWTGLFGLIGLGLATIAFGLLAAILIQAIRQSRPLDPLASIPTATPNATPNPDFLAPTHPGWTGTERVTVLLLGGDSRPDEALISRPRTDTIMLLMIDPVNHLGSVLSIPRDLYLDIPGYGLNRVNTAYVYGGPDLAIETIEYNLGIRVNYYAQIDFNVFVRLVDEIGGITIDVPQAISDPSYPDQSYGYDPFYIDAGVHHMDGYTALKYARTRATQGSDFDRAARQQAVLFAIRDKVLDPETFPQIMQKAPQLYDAVRSGISTDMSFEQMVALVYAVQQVDRSDIRSGVIDSEYVVGYETTEGARVLIPSRARIGDLLSYVFWLDNQ